MHDFSKSEVETKGTYIAGHIRTMNEGRKAHKENYLESKQTDFRER